uniref:Uncharacterized protein n=1 Tax=Meloidogyne javanica TaxID=6303 RepID=A0A915M1G7_MELJA
MIPVVGMKIYFHILFFILLLLYSIYASHDENRRNRQHRQNRRNRDSNANPVSPWRVLLGQASREDTQNFALGSYSPTNRRTNRHRNNQHEVVGDYPTTAEFGDTTDQNVLDNFNSLAINDNENNSLATNNPRGIDDAVQSPPRDIDDGVIYDVPSPPRDSFWDD